MRLFARLFLLAAFVLILAGCKTEIYANLSEREANAMLNALLSKGIAAEKTALGDNLFGVSVPDGDLQASLALLDAQGLPKGDRDSIGQVFAKSGIVSSPFEERVRYIYALGEEVSSTIQQIDGVMVARVHLVMPEAPELGQELQPSSAAVFIKQKPGFDLDFLMPQVRRLVANAIEGLSYEEVAVVLVEATQSLTMDVQTGPELTEVIPGLRVEASDVSKIWIYAAVPLVLCLLALGGVGFLLLLLRQAKRRLSLIETEVAG